jgi:hypothetical protein
MLVMIVILVAILVCGLTIGSIEIFQILGKIEDCQREIIDDLGDGITHRLASVTEEEYRLTAGVNQVTVLMQSSHLTDSGTDDTHLYPIDRQ